VSLAHENVSSFVFFDAESRFVCLVAIVGVLMLQRQLLQVWRQGSDWSTFSAPQDRLCGRRLVMI
jgi:hypothetical protein